MPYPLYNVVHIVGIVLVMVALGGAAFASMAVHPNGSVARPIRRWTGIFHGIGLFLVLLGGFGMLARIGFEHGSS